MHKQMKNKVDTKPLRHQLLVNDWICLLMLFFGNFAILEVSEKGKYSLMITFGSCKTGIESTYLSNYNLIPTQTNTTNNRTIKTINNFQLDFTHEINSPIINKSALKIDIVKNVVLPVKSETIHKPKLNVINSTPRIKLIIILIFFLFILFPLPEGSI